MQKEVKEFRGAYGDTKVGEVTVNMVHHTLFILIMSNYYSSSQRCTEECEELKVW